MGNVLGKEQQHLIKKTSPVPLCDSKIFREICALYAVGILKQGIGTSIIQKLEQDVWKRQIDSWFVPNLWLYVIHHCQAWKQAGAHRHWLPGTVSIQQKLSGGTELFRACEQSLHSPFAGRWKQLKSLGCCSPGGAESQICFSLWSICTSGEMSHVVREQENKAGGSGLGQKVVLECFLKTLLLFLHKICCCYYSRSLKCD